LKHTPWKNTGYTHSLSHSRHLPTHSRARRVLLILLLVIVAVVLVLAFGLVVSFLSNASPFLSAGL